MTPEIATSYSFSGLLVSGGKLIGEGVYYLGELAGRGIESGALFLAPYLVSLQEKVSLVFLNNLPLIKATATLLEEGTTLFAIFLSTYILAKLFLNFRLQDSITKICIVAFTILLTAFLTTNISLLFMDPFAKPGILLLSATFGVGLGYGRFGRYADNLSEGSLS
jgi:hypothetical protein